MQDPTEQFLNATGLTMRQAMGMEDLQRAEVRWPYVLGLPFFDPEKPITLTTRMRQLHDWYLRESAEGRSNFGVRFKEEQFYRPSDTIWVTFEELYQLYHKDALDWTLMAIWTL